MAALTKEQATVIQAATKGHSIFLTGAAGTGKSFVVKELIRTFPDEGLHPTSSTGISSVQLGGVTVHSFVGIGNSAAPYNVLIMRVLNNSPAIKRIRGAKTLLLDEASMISLRMFELLNKIFQHVGANDHSFGGIQLILIADFCQLAPVPNSHDDGKYCFLSNLWTVVFPSSHCFLLTEVFRRNSAEFIRLLNEVRLSFLPEWVEIKLEHLSRPLDPVEGKETPRLNYKIIDCFIFNRERLHDDTTPDELKIISSTDLGSLSSVHLDQLLPVPHSLVLKINSPVMLMRNTDDQLKNGSRGVVDSFIDDFPVIFFPKEGRVKYFSRSTMVAWYATVKGKSGQRLQIPSNLSYSFSIHKSQSLRLERGELNTKGIFAGGQLYTGLSRFENFDTLRVLNFVKGKTKNIVSNDVIHFFSNLNTSFSTDTSRNPPSALGCCCSASSVELCDEEMQTGSLSHESNTINDRGSDNNDPVCKFFLEPVVSEFPFPVTLTVP